MVKPLDHPESDQHQSCCDARHEEIVAFMLIDLSNTDFREWEMRDRKAVVSRKPSNVVDLKDRNAFLSEKVQRSATGIVNHRQSFVDTLGDQKPVLAVTQRRDPTPNVDNGLVVTDR